MEQIEHSAQRHRGLVCLWEMLSRSFWLINSGWKGKSCKLYIKQTDSLLVERTETMTLACCRRKIFCWKAHLKTLLKFTFKFTFIHPLLVFGGCKLAVKQLLAGVNELGFVEILHYNKAKELLMATKRLYVCLCVCVCMYVYMYIYIFWHNITCSFYILVLLKKPAMELRIKY